MTAWNTFKRPQLVKAAHDAFGKTCDPIHTDNATIIKSLESGVWKGASFGNVPNVAPQPTAPTIVLTPNVQREAVEEMAEIGQAPVPSDETGIAQSKLQTQTVKPDLAKYKIEPEWLTSYHPRKLNGHTDVDIVSQAMENGQNVLLMGDAGTGKDHLANAVAAKLNRGMVTVSFQDRVDPDELIGHYTYIAGVGTVWIDGAITLAARHGLLLNLGEINSAPPSVTFVLHPLLDTRRFIPLSMTGEIVRAAKGFGCIATMNPDYRGTRPLNEAYVDRFDLPIVLEYDTAIEKKLVKDLRLIKLAQQLRQAYRDRQLTRPCSTRALLAYERNLKAYGPEIAQDCFVNRYESGQRIPVQQAFELHMKSAKGEASL